MERVGWLASGIAVLLVVGALVPAFAGATHRQAPENDSYRADDGSGGECEEWEHRETIGPVCEVGSLLKVRFSEGSTGYIHGADPAPADPSQAPAADATAGAVDPPACAIDLADGYYGVFIYAVAHDDTDRYDDRRDNLQSMIGRINSFVSREAERQGEQMDVVFRCTEGGRVEIRHEVLPTDSDDATFSTIVGDLEAKGYDDPHRKYWIWYDDRDACWCGGYGTIYADDRLVSYNHNNGRHPMYGVNFGYWDREISLHENGHNMGAVQDTAPDSTWSYHCNDGQDTMCYADGGDNESYDPFVCTDHKHFDCHHDTYFDPTPEPGSYLAEHWNLGSELNRFVDRQGANGAPTLEETVCSPDPVGVDTLVDCTLRASDDSAGVYYRVDWGDGNTSRIPGSGYLSNGTDASAHHEWERVGTYDLAVRAYDWADMAGNASQFTQTVVNHAPVLEEIDCPAEPDEGRKETCTLQASDDSDGVHYEVDWGDGTDLERVPASGTVPPSESTEVSHRWLDPGEHEVRVTVVDDEAEPKADTGARNVSVQAVPCTLDEQGLVPVGLLGFEMGSISTHYVGYKGECRGEPFTLEGSPGSDFDICFFDGQREEACYTTLLDEEGTIPPNTHRSEIYLVVGAAGQYHFTGPDA